MVRIAEGDRSKARRTEILRKAAAVFRRKGFHGAGMRDIARELDMAPGALYYYFESKQDLLYVCQTLSLQRLLESATRIAGDGLAPDRKLRALVRAHLAHVLDEFGGSFAHIEFHALPERRLAEVVARRDKYERLIRQVLREGIEAGVFRRMDVKLAALALLGALNWTAVWWRPEGHRAPEALADRMAETFLEGFLA